MKTILITALTGSILPFLLICPLLCIASYYTGLYFRTAREKKLQQNLARIKESQAYEISLCSRELSERTYQDRRKKQINEALISYFTTTPFNYQAEPRQTAKDILTLHSIVVAAELASCGIINGKITDFISSQLKQMERIPHKLPEEKDTDHALKLMISAAIKETPYPS